MNTHFYFDTGMVALGPDLPFSAISSISWSQPKTDIRIGTAMLNWTGNLLSRYLIADFS